MAWPSNDAAAACVGGPREAPTKPRTAVLIGTIVLRSRSRTTGRPGSQSGPVRRNALSESHQRPTRGSAIGPRADTALPARQPAARSDSTSPARQTHLHAHRDTIDRGTRLDPSYDPPAAVAGPPSVHASTRLYRRSPGRRTFGAFRTRRSVAPASDASPGPRVLVDWGTRLPHSQRLACWSTTDPRLGAAISARPPAASRSARSRPAAPPVCSPGPTWLRAAGIPDWASTSASLPAPPADLAPARPHCHSTAVGASGPPRPRWRTARALSVPEDSSPHVSPRAKH